MDVIKKLFEYAGKYHGKGINHEQEPFSGDFSLTPIINGHGAEILFTATGENGTVYHEEKSQLALSPDERPYLWSLNSNAPFMFQHELRETEHIGGGVKFVFGLNNPDDKSTFREEIHLELLNTGEVGYHYYWGMPNGEFAYRSGLRMKRKS